ncbi:MAG: selenide, water dikinase SelD [Planctomycetes bacterium GWF2_50_10]|nr:MAG: selenide, water dikinase SelD [Planctomycetes bacterium GWF2_50_10]
MADMEKRKRVMQRSIALGHCICDARKPCPCDIFKQKNICLCAGERVESVITGPVRLTQLVEKPGCASKIDQAFLKSALKGLSFAPNANVLVGAPAGDDAGVYKISSDCALVQTVDVFSPVVDDPYTFGQIAAANSVSDIYAMGAKALTALSVIAFPARELPDHVMHDILRGGIDKMTEAGVAIIGGHSINDPQIKAGFAVTGIIHPSRICTNANARPGDVLILTKALGTGIISFAWQIGRTSEQNMKAAAISMATLNKKACELMLAHDIGAVTDVTGFSLMGHLAEMASSSSVDVEIVFDHLPLLPGVLEAAADGILPGAIERNKESCLKQAAPQPEISSEMLDICFDAQTSGGLLISVSPKNAQTLLVDLHKNGISDAAIVGRVLGPGKGIVHLASDGTCKMPQPSQKQALNCTTVDTPKAVTDKPPVACCADAAQILQPGGSNVPEKFIDFLKSANAPGALDAHTKQAMAIALSVLAKCEPCLKMHLKKAQSMGFSRQEIDEAGWMAIAFGGSPTMMFYNDIASSVLGN